MVECWLPYGRTEIFVSVDVKDLQNLAELPHQDPSTYASEIISKSIDTPRGKKIEELIGPDCTASIAIEGTTTPSIAALTASFIVEKLVNLVVPREKISLIIANGIFESSNKDLLKTLKTAEQLKGVNILEHTKSRSLFSNLGKTHAGTPALFNKEFVESTLKIAVAEVHIDTYTGFTGSHTAVFPGLASKLTIEANRKLVFKGDVKPGVIEFNLVKEDALEATNLVGIDFSVNLITNYQDKLLGCYSGKMEEAWGQAIYSLGSGYLLEADSGADIIIVSAGGIKWDRDLYSATWALSNANKIVKKGGIIIMLAECEEGLGPESYSSLAQIQQLNELERRYSLGAEALQAMKSTLLKAEVYLVSSLPKYMIEPLGLKWFRTANEAYAKAIENRRGRKTLVIPYGSSTITANRNRLEPSV